MVYGFAIVRSVPSEMYSQEVARLCGGLCLLSGGMLHPDTYRANKKVPLTSGCDGNMGMPLGFPGMRVRTNTLNGSSNGVACLARGDIRLHVFAAGSRGLGVGVDGSLFYFARGVTYTA